MKIIWSPLALARIEEIFDYIANDNIEAAQNFISNVFAKIETLLKFPECGRYVPESNNKILREVFEGGYRIIYKIEPDRIIIVTVRSFKQLLKDKDIE